MDRILDLIENPKDIHNLSCEELEILSTEIREEIVSSTSKVGGHVSSSLGAVEIILAVHSLIESPKDKFIFDVGHQSYAHKLITGRKDQFKNMRTYGGISGFTRPTESDHDIHFSGHASDSLSIAMGLAKAKKLNNSKEKIVALVGDASIAGGMAFEAINQIGHENLPIVIILNDNNMSISASVGGFIDHLQNMRLNSKYTNARDAIMFGLKRFGSFGDFALKWGHASKESFKHFIMPEGILFEEIGITCMPTVDGHDIASLRKCIRRALSFDGPVLVHAITKKGAGYLPAAKDPELFHGIGAYDIESGYPINDNGKTYTNVFEEVILEEASKDEKIVALTAAMSGGTGLKKFSEKYPRRFVDVGIAEEHLVGTAAGLAKGGKKPVVAVYSSFLQRAIDQMIVNVAIEKLDVVFCIDRAGLVGPDGVTHQGIFDLSYCLMIPNLKVIAPSCAYDLKCALHTALNEKGPFAIRYPRGNAIEIDDEGNVLDSFIEQKAKLLKLGKSRMLKKGKDATILAFGSCVEQALKARSLLGKKGLKVRVVDMRYAKPVDTSAIRKAAVETHNIVSVEDGILNGGAGSMVLNELTKLDLIDSVKFKNLGVDDAFVTHGDVDKLKTTVKIDADSISKAVVSLIV